MIPLLFSMALAQGDSWLFVGNSYTARNDLAGTTEAWLNQTLDGQPAVTAVAVAPGGYTLPRHLADAQGTGALADALGPGAPGWTAVVLQDQSQIPGFPQTEPAWIDSRDAAVALAGMADDTGAEVFLFLTWGRREGDDTNPSLYPDYATMQDRLGEGYAGYRDAIEAAGTEAWIVPVGEVYRELHNTDPTVFDTLYAADDSHPSEAGTEAAAATFVATWSGRLPPEHGFTPYAQEGDQAPLLAAVDRVVVESPGPSFPWYHRWEDWPADTPIHGDARRPLVHVDGPAEAERVEVGDGRLWLEGGSLSVDELVLGELSELRWTSGELRAALVQGHLAIPAAGRFAIADQARVEGRVSGEGTLRWEGELEPGEGLAVLWANTFELDAITVEVPEDHTWAIDGHELIVTRNGGEDTPKHGESGGCGCASGPTAPTAWLAFLPLALISSRRARTGAPA